MVSDFFHDTYIFSECPGSMSKSKVRLPLTNYSILLHLGASPSPLILWSPMGSESSMPGSCPPSNEVWPKEEPGKIWPKEEPVDVEMHPTPLNDMPPAPLPDPSMHPPSLPDALFASPETWISSLPSKHTLLYFTVSQTAVSRSR